MVTTLCFTALAGQALRCVPERFLRRGSHGWSWNRGACSRGRSGDYGEPLIACRSSAAHANPAVAAGAGRASPPRLPKPVPPAAAPAALHDRTAFPRTAFEYQPLLLHVVIADDATRSRAFADLCRLRPKRRDSVECSRAGLIHLTLPLPSRSAQEFH